MATRVGNIDRRTYYVPCLGSNGSLSSFLSEDNQGSTVAHVPTPLQHPSAVAIGLSLHMVCLETM